MVARSDLLHPLFDHLRIMPAEIGVFFESLAVPAQQVREVLLEKRKEDLLSAGLQEYRRGAERRCSALGRRFADSIQALLAIVDQRHDGMRQHSHRYARFRESPQGRQTQRWTRRPRTQQSRKRFIHRRYSAL